MWVVEWYQGTGPWIARLVDSEYDGEGFAFPTGRVEHQNTANRLSEWLDWRERKAS